MVKHAVLTPDAETLSRITAIERDIALLKTSILRKATPSHGRIAKLKGVLKGVDISDDEIDAAKKSLYSSVRI